VERRWKNLTFFFLSRLLVGHWQQNYFVGFSTKTTLLGYCDQAICLGLCTETAWSSSGAKINWTDPNF